MAEHIEREAVMQAFSDFVWNSNHSDLVPAPTWNHAVDIVRDIPAADVVEVRHGRWSMTKDGAAYCSACKRKMNPYLYGYAHCAMCGARMDGGVNRIEIDTVKNGGVNDGKAD